MGRARRFGQSLGTFDPSEWGQVALDLPSHRTKGDRIRAALAKRGGGLLHEAEGKAFGVRIQAFLGPPDLATATARGVYLFVKGRFVRDRNLLQSLLLGYGALLPKGRYPSAVLFVDVPDGQVDINVHPQKLEVRFSRGQEVFGAVRRVLREAVARAPWLTHASRTSHTGRPVFSNGNLRGQAESARSAPSPSKTAWSPERQSGEIRSYAREMSLPLSQPTQVQTDTTDREIPPRNDAPNPPTGGRRRSLAWCRTKKRRKTVKTLRVTCRVSLRRSGFWVSWAKHI